MEQNDSKYGVCEKCHTNLVAVWFTEEETAVSREGFRYSTGRKRRAVNYLYCPECFAKYCVDDSFDGPWR